MTDTCDPCNTFEVLDCLISKDISTRLIVIYRPPSSNKSKLTVVQFHNIKSFPIVWIIMLHIVITGDFNFHVDNLNDHNGNQFLALIESFGCSQNVHRPTHKRRHTLELILTRRSDVELIQNIKFWDPALSDHFVVTVEMPLYVSNYIIHEISHRKLSSVDRNVLSKDVFTAINSVTIYTMRTVKRSKLTDAHASLKYRREFRFKMYLLFI